jgi:hypothetical protein
MRLTDKPVRTIFAALILAVLFGFGHLQASSATVPGSVNLILKFHDSELSYAANGAGWSRVRETCISWNLERFDPDKSIWLTVESGRHCARGNPHMSTRFVWCPGQGEWRLKGRATGPGGPRSASHSVEVWYD